MYTMSAMRWHAAALILLTMAVTAHAQTTQPAVSTVERPAIVHFTIDAARDVHPISPFIYGVNRPCHGVYANLTLTRLGGNRWTCFNWTNNASNAGNDYHYQNDGLLGGGNVPGGAVAGGIADAERDGAGIILTIPINGYVSADKSPHGDVRASGPDYLRTRFRPERPFKNAPFTLSPDPRSPVVYQDEFVNWVRSRFPAGFTDPSRPIFFMLDNEPALWSATHAQVHPQKVTFQELTDKSIDYARAVKSVAPQTLVFGPAEYGWTGFVTLQHAPDAAAHGNFLDFYLSRMSQAQTQYGRRLLDVLDVHWYPEARGGKIRITDRDNSPAVTAARVQAPRSLWDASYVENSWVSRSVGAIALLPRLQSEIDRNYPGTLLSISEYNYGGGDDISGAIAEADVLGIFGRENLFAACEWPNSRSEPFVAAAFALYRNFDGHGASFGDQSIHADTDDAAGTSVYAGDDNARMVLIALNKQNRPADANVTISRWRAWTSAQVYQLTAESAAPRLRGRIENANDTRFTYEMPPMSASAIVLR